jgi:hypothetical protein
MTMTKLSPGPSLAQLLRLANPVAERDLGSLGLNQQFDRLLERVTSSDDAAPEHPLRTSIPGSMRRARTRRRRSRRFVVGLAGGAAVVLTGGVAAASWTSAHTGLFGKPGMAENDTTEWLNTAGDDFPQVARGLATGIPFPPGDSAAAYIPIVFAGGGLVQASGVQMTLSIDAACAWQGYWLQAHAKGDTSTQAAAADVLAQVPGWHAIANHDGGGTVDSYKQVATAAAANDAAPIQQSWTANCAELPRGWVAP